MARFRFFKTNRHRRPLMRIRYSRAQTWGGSPFSSQSAPIEVRAGSPEEAMEKFYRSRLNGLRYPDAVAREVVR